ncbi:TIGR04076 family protein [Candidatus Nomurabacteria bacterium]|nr:TIGR04076 family protein [Candidatus Nomurabacteria bacterium]
MKKSETFTLYDLHVEVVGDPKTFVCKHILGSAFVIQGENLVFDKQKTFSMYALAAMLPLLPAKQRPTHENDWMTSDENIACPDPHCGARFKISRTGVREFHRSDCTVVPIEKTA